MKHYYFSPSDSPAWIRCPGKLQRVKALNLPKDEGNKHSRYGNLAHYVAEQCLLHDLEPKSFKGQSPDLSVPEQVVDEELIQSVNYYIEKAKDLILDYPGCKVKIEHQGMIETPEEVTNKCGGTVDLLIDAKKKHKALLIVDLKNGVGVSVSPESEQLKIYALGAVDRIEDLKKYKEIHCIIIQPRDRTGQKFKRAIYRPKDLIQWAEDTLYPAMLDAETETPRIEPGVKQCRWCRYLTVCDEAEALAKRFAPKEYSNGPPERVLQSQSALAHKLEMVPFVEMWAGAIRKAAYKMLHEAGGEIPGFPMKLVPGKQSRKWAMEAKDIQFILSTLLNIDPFTKSLLTPAAAEKKLDTKGKKALSAYYNKTAGAPVMAPAEDSRKAISLNPEDDFDAGDLEG